MIAARVGALCAVTLAACGAPPTAPPSAHVETVVDVDEPCGPRAAGGFCPEGRVCAEGACIVDIDPGAPRDADDLTKWQQLWSTLDEHYAGFAGKPSLDWDAVHASVARDIAAATTRLEAEWAMTRGAARIGDGHTGYASTYLCELDPGFSRGISNLGACATEVDGSLFIYRALPPGSGPTASDTGLAAGDEILAIDGRDPDELLGDLDAQPRCAIAASTAAQHRARLVQSVLFRADTDAVITVRRADGSEQDLPLSFAADVIDCDGRVGVTVDALYPGGVEASMLPGDIALLHFPLFGSFEGNDFIDDRTLEGLRDAMERVADPAAGVRGLVLDLRNNAGGYVSVYQALASWLYDAPTQLFRCKTKDGPTHDAFAPERTLTAEPDTLLNSDVPLIVLTSATSFSAADFTPMFLQRTGRAALLGQPTAGGFGSGNGEAFGDDFVAYSDVACASLDGAPLEGAPPAPTVRIDYRPEDLAAGVDTLIEDARRRLARD